MIISGSVSGMLIISSSTTGMTLRALLDHVGHAISAIDVAANTWLATSMDKKMSIWKADWSKDICELVDWVTIPSLNSDEVGFNPRSTQLLFIDFCQKS